MGTPVTSSRRRDSSGGRVLPPLTTIRSAPRSRPSRRGSSPRQIAGTPAVKVTRCRDIRSASRSGSIRGPGEDQVGAGEHRGVRQAPGVDVEHRHDRHHDVALADREAVDAEQEQGVQHDRAMAVERALGPARGAGGVAEARGVALVDRDRFRRLGRTREELLVVDDAVVVGHRLVSAVVHHHDAPDRAELRHQWPGRRQERRSTNTMSSSASLTMWMISRANSRWLTVCRTRPLDGTAR